MFDRKGQRPILSYITKNGTTIFSIIFLLEYFLQCLIWYYYSNLLHSSFVGMADANNISLPIKDALKDSLRIRYHYGNLSYLLKAIKWVLTKNIFVQFFNLVMVEKYIGGQTK